MKRKQPKSTNEMRQIRLSLSNFLSKAMSKDLLMLIKQWYSVPILPHLSVSPVCRCGWCSCSRGTARSSSGRSGSLSSPSLLSQVKPNIYHPLYLTRKIIYWGSGSLIRIYIPEILCLHLSPSTLYAQYSKAILSLVLVGGDIVCQQSSTIDN